MFKVMRLTIILLILFSSLFPSRFTYAEGLPVYTGEGLTQTQTTKIKTVIDPLTLQLSDGMLVRLSSIDLPDLTIYEQGEISTMAIDVLKDMLTDETVILYQTPKLDWGRTTRMGHELAHVVRAKDKVWVQGTLLRLGLARMRTTPRNAELANEMRRIETLARHEKLGLWNQCRYGHGCLNKGLRNSAEMET